MVDLPIKMVMFHSYVNVYQRVSRQMCLNHTIVCYD